MSEDTKALERERETQRQRERHFIENGLGLKLQVKKERL